MLSRFNSWRTLCLLFLLQSASPLIHGADAVPASSSQAETLPSATPSFNRDVRPILSEHCFECHGPDAAKRKADLRFDVEQSAKHMAINVDAPDQSPLIDRILSIDPDVMMPPPDLKKPLSSRQIETLRDWVRAGAPYEQHWAFLPITKPQVPVVAEPSDDYDSAKDGSDSRTAPAAGGTGASAFLQQAIDHFVLARLQQSEMHPSPPADRRTLIRRVTLDLTGLPPAPDEIDTFLNDDQPGAYERVVDRLLQSRHFGEHRALPWIEAARYADTSGYQADWERYMWPWRDWVINAFNDNMPFDRFTIEQLAGDMLPNATPEQILATGFNRNHRINNESGSIAAEFAVEYVVDRVDTTSTVWLGLTMGCCRCHDHKYDPLPQQDFYNMFAVFNNVPENGTDGRPGFAVPAVDYPNPDAASRIAAAEQELAAANSQLDTAATTAVTERTEWEAALRATLNNNAVQWEPITPASVTGSDGVVFTMLDDGSYLRSGPNPARATYTIQLPATSLAKFNESPLTGIRLDALTHESMTNKSLAPSVNGNFVLSEFTAAIIRDGKPTPIDFALAIADHEQTGYPAAGVIDGKLNTGWAVNGQDKREDRALVLTLKQPFVAQPGDRLRLQLRHESQFGQHVIGRFRISTTTTITPSLDGTPTLPADVLTALTATTPDASHTSVLNAFFRESFAGFAELRKQRDTARTRIAEAKKRQFLKVMVMSEMATPRETYILNRGEYDQPDKTRPAQPDVPAMLGGLQDRYRHDRLGFAQWVVSNDNPLTARVTVNRFWQSLFGRGLVRTVEDFGAQGTPPSHPDLLDWLAADFRDNGWNVKALFRQIVTSGTYRQSSVVRPADLERDPENILLGRTSRVRLSGYQLRDQALAASGLLVREIGGASVKPYQPDGLWEEISFQDKSRSTDFYVQDHGDKLYRRGLYTFWKRSVAPPMLTNFDAAGREACVVRSNRTSTPLQALNLMNDVTFVEAARSMAQRMIQHGGSDTTARIDHGLSLLAVAPRPSLSAKLTAGLRAYSEYFQTNPAAATEFLANGEWQYDESIPAPELAAWTALANVILNLDEVVVRQ